MDEKIVTKERQDNEIRDSYMSFTIGVQAEEFDKYLPIVMGYMDAHKERLFEMAQIVKQSNYKYKKIRKNEFRKLNNIEYREIKVFYETTYRELQSLLRKNGCGKNGTEENRRLTCRKVLNTYIKTGFIKPLFEDYRPECEMYLKADNDMEKSYIKGQVFYQYGSSAASYNENHMHINKVVFRDIQFIFKTLYNIENHRLTEKDIIGLMITVPYGASDKMVKRNTKLIEKGYLTKEELIQQYNISKYISLIMDKTVKNGVQYFERHFNEILKYGEIRNHKYEVKLFEDRKYNQIGFMMAAIADYPGIKRVEHAIQVTSISDDWEHEDRKKNSSKRDPIAHQLYRNYLLDESVAIFNAQVCYADKKGWKAVVASHIVPFNECEGLGHKEWQYDGDNGLLLSPNVDAYFDKFDISFESDGTILMPDDNQIVKSEIKDTIASYKLDEKILNDRRKEYLRIHKQRFMEKHYCKKI